MDHAILITTESSSAAPGTLDIAAQCTCGWESETFPVSPPLSWARRNAARQLAVDAGLMHVAGVPVGVE